MVEHLNVAMAPKDSTFQVRINSEIKKAVEEIYARTGMTLTDAFNTFIQQSLNAKGLPFLLSPENAEYMKAKSVQREILLDESAAAPVKAGDRVGTIRYLSDGEIVGEGEITAVCDVDRISFGALFLRMLGISLVK